VQIFQARRGIGVDPVPKIGRIVGRLTIAPGDRLAAAKSFNAKTFGAKPRADDSFATFLARPSADPVCEPNKISSGSVVGGVAVAVSAGADECRPARKPLSHARCSGVNGAVSGMNGTGFIQ